MRKLRGAAVFYSSPPAGAVSVSSDHVTVCPVYVQASNQTDVENWVTAVHSASASHLAKRQGREDTVRLLRNQRRSLLQKIDMDGKMKKMAELQLTVIADQRNRKAVEGQVGKPVGKRGHGFGAHEPVNTNTLSLYYSGPTVVYTMRSLHADPTVGAEPREV